MVWMPAARSRWAPRIFYEEERPVHRVTVDGFWMDEHPVTVRAFRRFVKASGYVTVAERSLDPAQYPDADPGAARAGVAGLPALARAGRSARLPQPVDVRARRVLASAGGPGQ
jgi:formylglycine-generating enzyme required for sulfatase activity